MVLRVYMVSVPLSLSGSLVSASAQCFPAGWLNLLEPHLLICKRIILCYEGVMPCCISSVPYSFSLLTFNLTNTCAQTAGNLPFPQASLARYIPQRSGLINPDVVKALFPPSALVPQPRLQGQAVPYWVFHWQLITSCVTVESSTRLFFQSANLNHVLSTFVTADVFIVHEDFLESKNVKF